MSLTLYLHEREQVSGHNITHYYNTHTYILVVEYSKYGAHTGTANKRTFPWKPSEAATSKTDNKIFILHSDHLCSIMVLVNIPSVCACATPMVLDIFKHRILLPMHSAILVTGLFFLFFQFIETHPFILYIVRVQCSWPIMSYGCSLSFSRTKLEFFRCSQSDALRVNEVVIFAIPKFSSI